MFEELNEHRAAVAENIQKACEIGFTGNELEKAHKVGDIHPNGKWVWTQLPSGRYDWRVIKKTSAPSGGAAPATAQKTTQSGKIQLPGIGKELVYESKKEPGKLIKVVGLEPDVFAFKKMTNGAWVKTGESKTENTKKLLEDYVLKKEGISISANHPSLSGLKGVSNMKEYLTTFNSKYTDMSKVEVMRTPKGNWDVHYDGHRLGIFAGDQVPESTAKKMGWLRTDSKDLTRSKRDAEKEAKKTKKTTGDKEFNPKDPYQVHAVNYLLGTPGGWTMKTAEKYVANLPKKELERLAHYDM